MASPFSQQKSLSNKNSERIIRPGRNERCYCGSGKKYKKCCLAKDEREQRERSEYHARWDTEIWYPKASDLELPDVPERLRTEARVVLDRAFPLMFNDGIGVRAGECWEIAQSLTRAAKGKLSYVEGVWDRARGNKLRTTDREFDPVPHGYNAFEGHTVDLIAEFYGWRSSGEDSPWLHEALRHYTFEDLRNFDKEELVETFGLDGDETIYAISPAICLEGRYSEYFANFDFGIDDVEPIWEDENYLFKDARERLLARINGTIGRAA